MREQGRWGILRIVGIFAWFAAIAAGCAAPEHDCYELRNCPRATRVDAGSEQAGEAGAAGESPFDDAEAGAPPSMRIGHAGESPASSAQVAPPRIVRVSPSDGAVGVAADCALVIQFSQAMASDATEAAYSSTDLPAEAVTFVWSDDAHTLTITPRAPLQYAMAIPAQSYQWGFASGAVDRLGNAIEPSSFRFSTLREAALVVPADPERTGSFTTLGTEGMNNCQRHPKAMYEPTVCVGDDSYDARYTGFLSFDLSALPSNVARFSSVRLLASAITHGAPDQLGVSRVEHLAFGEIGQAALNAAEGSSLGPIYGGQSLPSKTLLQLSLDLTATVGADYFAGNALSQYRLAFERGLENGQWDDLELPTSQIRLSVVYLVP